MNNAVANKKNKLTFGTYWERFGTLSILVLILIGFSIASPTYFLSLKNISQIGMQSTIYTVLAFGEFFAILLAGIDLSVGSVAAFCGAICAKLLLANCPVWLAVVAGIAMGVLMGAVNGTLINLLQLHPFVVTLGTNTIFRGVALVMCNGKPIFGLPAGFKSIALYIGGSSGFPIPFLIVLVMAAILIWFTKYTVAARNMYALGGNREAAWYSGINVHRHQMIVYMISGTCAGLAGIVLTGRLNAAAPTAGIGYETYAIAATIIGGTSFFGGIGKIPGVVAGGLIIGIINYGMTVLMIDSSLQKVVMGALIIIAVTLDHFVTKSTKKA